jgi:hypothetical protein
MAEGLIVTFYTNSVNLPFESEKKGKPISEDREFIRILKIGDKYTVIDQQATQKDRETYPVEYERYKKGQGEMIVGTHLKDWPAIGPSMIKMLNYKNIWTVEHLAECGDQAMQSIGMGAREWVAKAKAYLANAKDGSAVTRYAAENERMKSEIDAFKEQMQMLMVQTPPISSAAGTSSTHPVGSIEPIKRKPGRPRTVHDTINETA